MNRLVSILTILALTLTACATDTSLWGVYSTPTAPIPTDTVPVTATVPPPTPTATTVFTDPRPTGVPTATFTFTPTFDIPIQITVKTITPNPQNQPILYYAQSGDTLDALAARFGVGAQEITSPKNIPETALIDAGTLLIIPDRIDDDTSPNIQILPDSEIIYSATASDFNSDQFIANASGHLSAYREYLGSTGWTTGPQAIKRVTEENSINPRLLLAVLEYESRWVYSAPATILGEEYPMGFQSLKYKGLFLQMVWAVNQLFNGYYGWRTGTLTELTFPNGETLRLHPELNAGTVAVQYFFSRRHNRAEWEGIVSPESVNSFYSLYLQMFGDPWARAQAVEPLFPPGTVQPKMVLPFEPNREWSLTGGPHGAWEHDGPLAAIDFAPSDAAKTWVLSAAPGLVVRSANGVVMVDLDGDGDENTGWNLLYLHIATDGRVPLHTWVQTDDRIGRASSEGGVSTGSHLHFARKYNGEWIAADGPLPFVLGGWTVHAGAKPYDGTLTRGGRTVTADPVGQAWSVIIRLPDE